MSKKKIHNKYTSWRVGSNSGGAALIFYAFPMPLLFILILFYDIYLLWFNKKYAVLRSNTERFRTKKLIIYVYGFAGFFASFFSSKGDMVIATIFISFVLMAMVIDSYYHLKLFPKGR